MIHIAFFEDQPIVCKGLNSFFSNQKDFEVLFYATNKLDLYSKIEEHSGLDLIIVDLIANDVQGLEVYNYLHKNYPNLMVIAFTSLSSPILVENLLAMGVKGYVNKNQDIEELLEAIEIVWDGGIYLPDDYSFLSKQDRVGTAITLTAKELTIMQYIIREFTTADIAKELQLSVNTVENHRKNIFHKLDVSNVAGMVREASKLGHIN